MSKAQSGEQFNQDLTKNKPACLQGTTLVIATIAVALATFMVVLDTSIANVAIPTISGNLGVSLDEGTWVITIFGAANAVSIPLTGWLTQRFGQIRLFVSCIFLFVVASWLCGFAHDLTFLLVARVFQGFIAGPLIPLSQAILLGSYARHRQAMAMSFWGMTATVGPIAGPTLGGWITDSYHWPWIFYINIPVGLIAGVVIWLIYRDRETPKKIIPIDKIGLCLLIIWVSSLQVMLDKGKDLDWFNSPVIVTLGITAFIGFIVFLIWELTEEHPVVDLTLFANRNFTGGAIAISIGYAVFFGNLVILPQWLQQDLAYSTLNTGLILAPLGVFAVICSPIVGKLLPKVDARYLTSIAFALFSLVFFLRSNYLSTVDPWSLIAPTLLQGVPMAMFFIPLSMIILSTLPPEKISAGAGVSNFARVFCGSIGTSLANTEWSNRSILHHVQLTEVATQYSTQFNEFMKETGRLLAITPEQSFALFNALVNVQANTLGLNDIFWASSLILILLIPIVWITKPAKHASESAAVSGAH
ncbi:MAG: DHA2 family efflux MFS transporter permease subunit [Legionella sp.]|nr:DHA2 family efflux MFS transporter permease subunit [Legionella sp.]